MASQLPIEQQLQAQYVEVPQVEHAGWDTWKWLDGVRLELTAATPNADKPIVLVLTFDQVTPDALLLRWHATDPSVTTWGFQTDEMQPDVLYAMWDTVERVLPTPAEVHALVEALARPFYAEGDGI